MIKKFFLSMSVIVAFFGYALFSSKSNTIAQTATTVPIGTSAGPSNVSTSDTIESVPVATPTLVAKPVLTTKPIPTSTPAPTPVSAHSAPKGRYTDGVYTSAVADAFYGNVQIKTTIFGGNITHITFLQYPSDRSTSRKIAEYSMPILVQEAITAQSANIDGVSGASATSGAFIGALQGTLVKI